MNKADARTWVCESGGLPLGNFARVPAEHGLICGATLRCDPTDRCQAILEALSGNRTPYGVRETCPISHPGLAMNQVVTIMAAFGHGSALWMPGHATGSGTRKKPSP